MIKIAVLALSASAGAISRYALGDLALRIFGPSFPVGTFLVNALGCLIVGFLGTFFENTSFLTPNLRLAIFVGFLGSFTTFSSFAFETWSLFKQGDLMFAGLNVLGSFLVCFAALFIGVYIAKFVLATG
ncbi:fluoride efflux transporter CrcB [bacterium]|nr:fluoride efflux transporter CrcB [bacterium]